MHGPVRHPRTTCQTATGAKEKADTARTKSQGAADRGPTRRPATRRAKRRLLASTGLVPGIAGRALGHLELGNDPELRSTNLGGLGVALALGDARGQAVKLHGGVAEHRQHFHQRE